MRDPERLRHLTMAGEGQDQRFCCLHCAQVHRYRLPQPLNVWCRMVQGFIAVHRECPPPAEEPDAPA